jgi:hypothetical protein
MKEIIRIYRFLDGTGESIIYDWLSKTTVPAKPDKWIIIGYR